ncbi:hypothetical protein [Flagellimonas pacifica]|uniref:hypothetical protein n=1 Tax=Flagellimonas pacifica TaxID=1247520 RepID=UPI000BE46E9B|nr:hypothetical protein [Allomuricauda parva]
MSAGYSGIPLAKETRNKEGSFVLLHNTPKHYFDLFTDLPDNLSILKNIGVKNVDFIHIFCTSFQELMEIANKSKMALKKDGLLWGKLA